jgi:CHAT domain-containing protein/tetratricopeptide (TPR) repeat protein
VQQDIGHLSQTEIEESAGRSPGESSPSVEAHLSECGICLERLLEAQRAHFHFLESQAMRTEAYPDCPKPEVLQEIAAEMRTAENAQPVLQHASLCDYCGPLFKGYLRDFSEGYSPEFDAMLASLPGAQSKQRKELARKLAAQARGEKHPSKPSPAVMPWPFWKKAVAWATPLAALIIVGVGFGPTLMSKYELQSASSTLASAFPHRPLPMRLPGMPFSEYVPPIKELGPDSGNGNFLGNPSLLKAKSLIAENVRTTGKSAGSWNELEGRAALLEDPGNTKAAEDAFERARAARGNDPDLLIELAATYFERDIRSDKPNLSQTIDILNQVLKNPKLTREQRATALFNLAIAYEKSNALDMAVSTWNDYLNVDQDKTGPWFKEAKERLEVLKKKLPATKPVDYKQPAYLIRHWTDPDVQNDIEQYQDIAFADWLVPGIREPDSDYGKALRILASLMETQHSDTWWKDFLRTTRPSDLPAVTAFSHAYVADQNDFHYQAMQDAQRASSLFLASHNRPGELMARFQQVYALQRSAAGNSCQTAADLLSRPLDSSGYTSLRAKTRLELAICANLVSDWTKSDANIAATSQLARDFSFPELRLRTIGINASMHRFRGQRTLAWNETVQGLAMFWDRPYSYERLYQFYSVLSQCAKDSNDVSASEALLRRSIDVLNINAPQDITLRSLLHLLLANRLVEQNQDASGESEADHARELLKTATTQDRTAQTYSTIARIELAELELRRNHVDLAFNALREMPAVSEIQDDFVKLDFYAVTGKVMLASGNLADASAAYDHGIAVADQTLRALNDNDLRLSILKSTSKLYRGKVEVLLAQDKPEQALLAWESSKLRLLQSAAETPGSAGAQLKNAALTTDPSSSQTIPRIIFGVFGDHIQVWAVSGSTISSSATVVPQATLIRAVQQFTKLCSTPDMSQLKLIEQQSEKLYSLLFAPVAAIVDNADSVVIELDEPLASLAIEALKKPGGEYMGEAHNISYSPGIFAEKLLRPLRPSPAAETALAVDTSSSQGPKFLPGHDELDATLRRINPSIEMLRSTAATTASVKSALPKSSAFYFFGHARPDSTGVALEMGDGTLLHATEIRPALLAKSRIVVFAACASGTAENGLMDSGSLVRAVLATGVPSVISSHWNVDSRTTSVFIQSFYSHLETESPSEALRDARKETHALQPHPYFWAPFSLTGRAR